MNGVTRFAAPLVAIAFIDSLVYGTVAPVFPFFGREAGLGYSQTSTLAAFFAVGSMLSLPLRLWLLYRITPKTMLIAGALIGGMSHVLFNPAVATPVLFSLRFLHGFASGMLWMGLLTVVLAARKDGELTKFGTIFGLVLGTYGIGNLLGPLVGFLPSPEMAFQLLGALHLVAAAIVVYVPRTSHAAPTLSFSGFGHPQVRAGLISGFIAGSGLGLIVAAYPMFFADTLTSGQIGVTFALAAIPGILLSPYAGKSLQENPSPKVLVIASGALLVMIGVISAASWLVWWFVALCLARTLFNMLQTGSVTAMVADGPATKTYVFATAIWGIVFDIGYSASPALAGVLTESTGFVPSMWLTLAVLALTATVGWVLSGKLKLHHFRRPR